MSAFGLPDGVALHRLERFVDERGDLLPIFSTANDTGFAANQWNLSRSVAGTLRGVHVHPKHDDYVVVVAGEMLLGLHDLREASGTAGHSAFLTLSAADPLAVVIPSGVCHGFYFPAESLHVYATSEVWDPADEMGCRFDDPALGLAWPTMSPILSERDRTAGRHAQMRSAFRAALTQ